MVIECSHCGTKNRIPDLPRPDGNYRCGSCKRYMNIPREPDSTKNTPISQSKNKLIDEFIIALDEEIKAIKAGKGGSVVRVFDGRFIREESGVFIYSFVLENFIATIDDAPVEVQVGGLKYQGHLIQSQGLEVIIGVEHDFGPLIPEARVITDLSFLHKKLKEKFEKVRTGEISRDFALADLVFEGKTLMSYGTVVIPSLEPQIFSPNQSQLNAIQTSQELPMTFVWGPPGTGKTETIARIVECFIKRGMRVLVVAHANAAVDEATEDIAHILKATEFYNSGKIIRLGNYQKESLKINYDLVILENIAERLGASLKFEKDRLNQEKGETEIELAKISSVVRTIKEREELSKQKVHLDEATSSVEQKVNEISEKIEKERNHIEELSFNINKAETSGRVKRIFLGLDPVKLRQDHDKRKIRLDTLLRQLQELESQVININRQKADRKNALFLIEKNVDSLLKNLGLSEKQLISREKTLNTIRNKILSRINEIQKELEELQKRILSQANVVCTTLTKTFSAKQFPDTPFDVLVVDESSMAPMPYLYWALGRCKKTAVIVGDFLQLPPICISEDSMAKKWLGRSIYDHSKINTVSNATKDGKVCLLNIQYRMNPAIAFITNQLFYQGLLSNDPSTNRHIINEGLSNSPLTLIDTSSVSPWCSKLTTGGRFNIYNALLTSTTAKMIITLGGTSNIGIMTPYNAQARLISKILKDMRLERRIRVSTVHRFQGGEEDIIIFDTVEGPGVNVAPMLDNTRNDSDAPLLLNVATSRAKCKLFLIGNLSYLKKELHDKTILHRIIKEFERNGESIDSSTLVDSYFIRDFEKWIERFLESSLISGAEPPNGSLYTDVNFYPAFFTDLRRATEEVIILSPFLSTRRSGHFVELFRLMIQGGVKIKILTRPPKEQTGNFALNAEMVVEQMRKIGVEVTERRRMHQKVAIIDRSIAWEGSLNILSHRDSDEQMRRLPFSTAVNELIRLCEVEESSPQAEKIKREPVRTFEKCQSCGSEFVVRISKYGPFLSCPDKNCPGKLNISKWDKIKTHTLCTECGSPMILRHGPKGPFLGCSEYPKCKKTMPIR